MQSEKIKIETLNEYIKLLTPYITYIGDRIDCAHPNYDGCSTRCSLSILIEQNIDKPSWTENNKYLRDCLLNSHYSDFIKRAYELCGTTIEKHRTDAFVLYELEFDQQWDASIPMPMWFREYEEDVQSEQVNAQIQKKVEQGEHLIIETFRMPNIKKI